jgi:glycosyltransferase involved in cell wall biosynthesis
MESIWAAAVSDGAGLLHINDYFFPLYEPERELSGQASPLRVLVTVRDIIPLHYPDQKRRGLARLRRNLFPLLGLADHVIAISRCTKFDLMTHLNVPETKITVIHHGVDHEVFHGRYPAPDIAATRRRYGLPASYILYVAGMDIRKNHRLLIDAFHYLNRTNSSGFSLALVGPGRVTAAIRDQVTQRRLQGKVHFLGEVPLRDLARLYAGAGLFAFPSLYEGFGNPLLEAMAAGAPVVALKRSTVPEIAGDAALLVEDNEYAAFGQAMARVLADPGLAGALRRKGQARAAEFTWEKTARLTLETYRRLLESSSTTTSS